MFFSRASDRIRNTTEQDIKDVVGEGWGDFYRLGMGLVDSEAVDRLKKIHPALGLSLLGSSASTQAMLDAKQRGATDEQALKMGLFGGCFEMLVDAVGVGKLLKSDDVSFENAITKVIGEKVDGKTTELLNSAAAYMIIATNSNYEQDIQRYLAKNPTWSHEQAEKRTLIDAALKAAEEDADDWSSLVFAPKTQKQ